MTVGRAPVSLAEMVSLASREGSVGRRPWRTETGDLGSGGEELGEGQSARTCPDLPTPAPPG